MLELKNVSKFYNANGIVNLGLRNINLKFNKNEIVAITGESGSGKSTLLNVISKIDTFDEGEIYYEGNDTSYFDINDMDQFRKNKVGFIFQNYNIIDSYTVLENVMLPLIINGVSKKDAKERALELIEKVGLKDRVKNRGTKLSGGEKQRCVIARALASNCSILACDEPTGNLDSKTSEDIIKLIKEVAKDKLVLIVTHNFESVKDIVTRKIKIHDGEVAEDVSYKQISDNDETKEIDLDYKKMPFKTNLLIAKNNIIYTPKKTILISLVFLFVSIFALYLYQTVYYNQVNQSYINEFIYKGDNKVLAYDVEHKPLDMEKIKPITENYETNAFYFTTTYSALCGNTLYQMGYESMPSNLKVDIGQLPNNDCEVILLVPRRDKDYYSGYCGKKIILEKSDINSQLIIKDYQVTITGISYRDDINDIVLTGSRDIYEHIKVTKMDFYFNNKLIFNVGITKGKSILYLPDTDEYKSLTNNSLYYKHNTYKITFDYDIEYSNLIDDPVLKYANNDNEIYEVAIYGNPRSLTKKLDALGYNSINVKTFTNETKLQHYINNLLGYVAIIFSTIGIVIVYFISYLILAKVYASKKKDYTILRTLGITKNEMKRTVNIEVMIETIVTTIFSFIVLFVLGKTSNLSFFKVLNSITFVSALLYFIVMLLFGYLLARRFNRRLFKFSVNKTLKNEVAKND